MLNGRQAVAQAFQGWKKRVGNQQHLCARVTEYVAQLWWRETGVERDQHHACLSTGIVGLSIDRGVDVKDRNPVTLRHALGLEPADKSINTTSKLFECMADVAINDRGAIREHGTRPWQYPGDRHHVDVSANKRGSYFPVNFGFRLSRKACIPSR